MHRSDEMTAEASPQDSLPADLTMGTVMLKVGDMKVMTDYYQRALGLEVVAEQDGGLYLGRKRPQAAGPPFLRPLGLNCPPSARPDSSTRRFSSTTEEALAATVSRPRSTRDSLHRQHRPPRERGLLLHRPRRQRIELFWDRPAQRLGLERQYSRDGDPRTFDPNAFLHENLTEAAATEPMTGARVGHVHLQVGDVEGARDSTSTLSGSKRPSDGPVRALRVCRRLPPPHGHERVEQPRRRPPPRHPGPRRGAH